MNLQLNNDNEVFNYQNIEKEIFELNNFSPNNSAFPRNLFKIKFDKFYLIKTVDWFNSEPDFERLITFIKNADSNYFFASCPPFYMINAIKVSTNDTYQTYIENHSYTNMEHRYKGVGIRKSPETFFYDTTKNWAIVCDITTNITLIGLKNELINNFEKSFNDNYDSVKSLQKNSLLSEKVVNEIKLNYPSNNS